MIMKWNIVKKVGNPHEDDEYLAISHPESNSEIWYYENGKWFSQCHGDWLECGSDPFAWMKLPLYTEE